MKKVVYLLAFLMILLVISPTFVFVVDEREMAVVLRFGAPKHAYQEPGLHFKFPFVDSVERIPKVKQFWGDTASDLLPDLPTKDDKKVELVPWAIWRVNDPIVFVQRLRTMNIAEQRVQTIVRSAIRDVVTQYDLEEIVRSTDRALPSDVGFNPNATGLPVDLTKELSAATEANKPKGVTVGRREILRKIKDEATRRLAAKSDGNDASGRGIELLDVGISQIAFVSSVRQKTFDRWIAERGAISARNVNEGTRLKAKIVNEAKAEVAKIEGEGQQRANEIKGKADAEVIKIYADAMQQTGDFFTFVRTLEAYEQAIGPDTQLILSTDSQFFELFKELKQ